ncbi:MULTISPECIES: hypothetical protein [unclassified Pseudomonas]|uniref:hypothetical protein n=1 Tax=unclassified Pseudomonas TaxID=196821 RepID=UPI0025D3FEF2|nr:MULTISPECIES: hypothetical protein [unclassified Pseudomonas]
MSHSNAQLSYIESVTFTAESLACAIGTVSGYGEFAPELIAEEVFQQLAQVIGQAVDRSSSTVWLSRSGVYSSKLEAVRNGEQQVAPAVIARRVPR